MSMAVKYGMKKRQKSTAKGEAADDRRRAEQEKTRRTNPSPDKKPTDPVVIGHGKDGPIYQDDKPKKMADGGEVTKPSIDAEKGKLVSDSFKKSFGFASGGMVDRIMAKRCPADEMPNEFDELVLDPAPEDTSSAGNEIGDPIPDEDDDMVSRIMRRRSA